VAQLLVVLHRLGPRHPSDVTLVFMGMGEPLANLSAVRHAIEIFCNPAGLGLSPRRITLSTSGLLPEIEQLAALSVRPLLAVSLNATTEELRQQLMPIGRRYSMLALKKTLERYPLRPGERITIEYLLLSGVNDSVKDAQRLAEFVTGFSHHINLIVFNEFDGSGFSAPTEDAIDEFAQNILMTHPTVVTVRRSRGRDIQGACGQLARNRAVVS
jgi:23S rRNA (adenine2503-C2)-methyltransferase